MPDVHRGLAASGVFLGSQVGWAAGCAKSAAARTTGVRMAQNRMAAPLAQMENRSLFAQRLLLEHDASESRWAKSDRFSIWTTGVRMAQNRMAAPLAQMENRSLFAQRLLLEHDASESRWAKSDRFSIW